MTELTLTQHLTGNRIAIQRRHIPADTPTTILVVEGISFAVTNMPCRDPYTDTVLPMNEVSEVSFPMSYTPDLHPGASQLLEGLFGKGFAKDAILRFDHSPGWEASMRRPLEEQSEVRIAAMTAIRTLIVDEGKTGITVGQIAHLTRQPVP